MIWQMMVQTNIRHDNIDSVMFIRILTHVLVNLGIKVLWSLSMFSSYIRIIPSNLLRNIEELSQNLPIKT